jgi:hypothetical protein
VSKQGARVIRRTYDGARVNDGVTDGKGLLLDVAERPPSYRFLRGRS